MRRATVLLLLCLPLSVCAAEVLPLRVCTFDRPFPPLTMPDGSGQAQELLRRAARHLPLAVNNVMASRPVCLAQLRSGEVDAMLAAFLPERLEYVAYPMQGEQPDEGAALAVARFMVFRRVDSKVDWDGRRFINLGQQPVGVQPGCVHMPLLRQMGVVLEESSRSTADNLGKLAQNRVAAVIGQDGEGSNAIGQQYRGQVEMLPQPFHQTPMYLAVNRQFYLRHPAQIDAYWAAIRQQRATPEYQQYLLPRAPR
jgi:hypothetical protein